MKKWTLGVVATAATALVIVALSYGEVASALLLGWARFLGRVAPDLHVNRSGLVFAALSVVLFAVGVHWLGHTLARAGQGRVWTFRLRWTLGMVTLVVLMFAAGTAMIGVAHQSAWLLTAPRPLYSLQPQLDEWNNSRENLRRTGTAFHLHHDLLKGLPRGGTFDANGGMMHSWMTMLLPFLNYASEIDLEIAWTAPKNVEYFKSVVPEFINPELRSAALRDETGFGLAHYAANSRVLSWREPMTFDEITDGRAHTILAGEVNGHFRPWGHPANWRDPASGIHVSPDGFGGPSSRPGTLFLMADGSVRVVRNDVDPKVLRALATPAEDDNIAMNDARGETKE